MPEEEIKALMIGTTLAVETRYAAISRILEHEGYSNMLDIACGFTPRSLYCYKKGVDYDQFAVRNMNSPDAITMYHASRKKVMAQANIYNDGVANWEENKMEN